VRGLFALALLQALGAEARADDAEQRKLHFDRGNELAKAGDHRGAVAEFQSAYKAAPHPNLLFNIAVEYRALSESPDDAADVRVSNAQMAIVYYRRYLAEAANPDRTEAEAAIAHLEEAQAALRPPPPAQPAPAQPQAQRASPAAPPTPTPRARPRLAVGIALATVGGLVAVAGAVLTGIAVSTDSGATAAPTDGEYASRKATASTERTAGIVSLAVGAAAVVVGVVVLALPRTPDRPVALRVRFLGSALSLEGSF